MENNEIPIRLLCAGADGVSIDDVNRIRVDGFETINLFHSKTRPQLAKIFRGKFSVRKVNKIFQVAQQRMNEKYEADAFIESRVRRIDQAIKATADKYADFQCVYDELKVCLRKCFTISEIQSHMETSFGLPGNDTEELIIGAIRPFHTAYLLFAEDASRQRQEVPEVEENTGGNECGEIYVEETEAVIAGGMDEHHVVTDAESASQSSGIREGQVEVNAGGLEEHVDVIAGGLDETDDQVEVIAGGLGEHVDVISGGLGEHVDVNESTNKPTNETTNFGGELTNVGILSSLKEVVESVEILKSEMKGIKRDLSLLNSLPMELKEILHKHNEVLKIIPDLRTKTELEMVESSLKRLDSPIVSTLAEAIVRAIGTGIFSQEQLAIVRETLLLSDRL